MTVDKFGHYYNQKHSDDLRRRNFSKNFNIVANGDNFNADNKRIINLATPLEGADAVTKTYMNSQINHMQELLKRGISKEVIIVRDEIKVLNKKICDIYDVMVMNSATNNGKKSDSQ